MNFVNISLLSGACIGVLVSISSCTQQHFISDGPSLQAQKAVAFSWKGKETCISLSPGPMIEFGQGHTYYTFHRKDDLQLDRQLTFFSYLHHHGAWNVATTGETVNRTALKSMVKDSVKIVASSDEKTILIQESTSNDGAGDNKYFTLLKWNGKFSAYQVSFPSSVYAARPDFEKLRTEDPEWYRDNADSWDYEDHSPSVKSVTNEHVTLNILVGEEVKIKLSDLVLVPISPTEFPPEGP